MVSVRRENAADSVGRGGGGSELDRLRAALRRRWLSPIDMIHSKPQLPTISQSAYRLLFVRLYYVQAYSPACKDEEPTHGYLGLKSSYVERNSRLYREANVSMSKCKGWRFVTDLFFGRASRRVELANVQLKLQEMLEERTGRCSEPLPAGKCPIPTPMLAVQHASI